jgi:CubicO group peptidase (beta-lactamase class C family)
MKLSLLVATLGLAGASSVGHSGAPATLVENVKARAMEAGFDGAILIGEADGSETTLATGTVPVGPDAIWRWASITKQLTAVLAMQEVARKRLDLDAPVTRYWPEWKAPQGAKIRIRDLLMHRSGLPQPDDSVPDKDQVPAFYRSGAAAPQDSASGFCAGPPRASVPTDFNYNNCDSIVLAEVLARITRKPFETLVRQRFARPLGMRTFGVFQFGPPAKPHVQPNGEYRDVDGLLNLGVYGASGGAYGTIGDLWRFDRALLRGKLAAPAQRELMWQSSADNGYYGFFPAPLKGCAKPVRIVERQGLVGGIELRNYLMPETGRGLILFSRHRPTKLGDPWEGKGFAFDLLSSVVCR